jgi:Apea-like HEPN
LLSFWTELVSAQDALLALGASYFDPQAMRSSFFRNQQVAVFLNLGAASTGYVAPAGTAGLIEIELANIHVQVPRLLDQLKAEYGFRQFDPSPLHGSIRLFASFAARAQRHHLSGHTEEALLHFIIALELIFGVRESFQKSVAERVSIITFRQSGRSFDQQRSWINRIYDLRSRYVHEGLKLADEAPVSELYALCQQVFRCLLRLQAAYSDASQRGKDALARWLSLLDFLSKGIIAGKTIDETQLNEAFIV